MRAVGFTAGTASVSRVASPEGAPLLRPPTAYRGGDRREIRAGRPYPAHRRDRPNAVNPSLLKNLPYDSQRAFAPITLTATNNLLLTVPLSLPVKSVQELIDLARAKPAIPPCPMFPPSARRARPASMCGAGTGCSLPPAPPLR